MVGRLLGKAEGDSVGTWVGELEGATDAEGAVLGVSDATKVGGEDVGQKNV